MYKVKPWSNPEPLLYNTQISVDIEFIVFPNSGSKDPISRELHLRLNSLSVAQSPRDVKVQFPYVLEYQFFYIVYCLCNSKYYNLIGQGIFLWCFR